jgi:hypothetical protein
VDYWNADVVSDNQRDSDYRPVDTVVDRCCLFEVADIAEDAAVVALSVWVVHIHHSSDLPAAYLAATAVGIY